MENQHPLKQDLLNKKFGLLTVIDFAPNHKNRTAWKCLCDCGNIKIVLSIYLTTKDVKSCGCLNDKKRSERSYNMYSKVIKYGAQEAGARRVWKKNYSESDLSFEDFYKLSQENCYYCDAKPGNIYQPIKDNKNTSKKRNQEGLFIYNGLDRVDNSLTHTLSNVVSCCRICNMAKRDRSLEEFKSWAFNIYINFNKEK